MYSPATRLLTVLELLQARGHLSGAELAARVARIVDRADTAVPSLQPVSS